MTVYEKHEMNLLLNEHLDMIINMLIMDNVCNEALINSILKSWKCVLTVRVAVLKPELIEKHAFSDLVVNI